MEQKISSFLRKWFKLSPSITNLSLYSSSTPCPLQFSSLSNVLLASKISGYLLLKDSNDPLVSSAYSDASLCKSSIKSNVDTAEGAIDFKRKFGQPQKGKAGLGYNPIKPFLPKARLNAGDLFRQLP